MVRRAITRREACRVGPGLCRRIDAIFELKRTINRLRHEQRRTVAEIIAAVRKFIGSGTSAMPLRSPVIDTKRRVWSGRFTSLP
jgi:hypothetical protein